MFGYKNWESSNSKQRKIVEKKSLQVNRELSVLKTTGKSYRKLQLKLRVPTTVHEMVNQTRKTTDKLSNI